MRKKNYKGRCEKRVISKCPEVCRTYDALQYAYADILQGLDYPTKMLSKAKLSISIIADGGFQKVFDKDINIKYNNTPKNAIDVSKEYDTTDTDKDGLPDVWEKYRIVYNGEFLNLPAMGANPNKPDIFVEVDWKNGLDCIDFEESFKNVWKQFNNHGINLHIDAGEAMNTETLPSTGGSDIPSNPSNTPTSNPNYNTPAYPAATPVGGPAAVIPSTGAAKLTVKAEVKKDTVTLTWDKINGAKNYTVYQYKDGKYVAVKTTEKTSVTFKKLKNGKTYKFLVRYTKNGKLSSTAKSGKVSVTVKYKPIVKATSTENSVTLKWSAVEGAEKYAVYKYVNGKAVKLTETDKRAVKYRKLDPHKKYSYIVRAYVDGKWTDMTKSDIVTVKTE